MWNDNYDVMIDITTRCNAGCPQCHRTDLNGLKKVSWLPDINWNLETFKKAYPENVIKNMNCADFCGTWGDPIANNNIVDMVKYIRDTNSDCRINLNTNGSIRSEEWWWNLGVIGEDKLFVVFAVEGINQKMQQQYRQFTFLDKILKNMETLSNTKARVLSQTIVWHHNENYLEEIEKMCVDHGSFRHHILMTDRWGTTNELWFTNHKGEKDVLRRAGYNLDKNKEYSVQKDRKRYYKKETKLSTHEKDIILNIKNQKTKMEIKCEWGGKNKILVNPDGQVFPCCFFCNTAFKEKFIEKKSSFFNHPLMKKYSEYEKELNVFNNNLNDIIKHKWFSTLLPNSWNTENPVMQCQKHCGKFSALNEL